MRRSSIAGTAGLAAVVAAPFVLATRDRAMLGGFWGEPMTTFWTMTVSSVLCFALAVVVLVAGWRSSRAEVGLLGLGLTVMSGVMGAGSLLTPGCLVAACPASGALQVLSLPVGLLAATPLLGPRVGVLQWVARHWRGWALGWTAVSVVTVVVLVRHPHLIDLGPATMAAGGTTGMTGMTGMGHGSAGMSGMGHGSAGAGLAAEGMPAPPILLALAAAAAVVRLAAHHVRLWQVGRRRASLWTAAGLATIAWSYVLTAVAVPMSRPAWLAYGADLAGVLGACAGALAAYRRDRAVDSLLAPVVLRSPLHALELGLSPEVHAFVAGLGRKDTITRDHVVRVAELAMQVGERAGLSGPSLRRLGLGALLHDIGKLVIPSAVLTKPGRLTDEEFAVIATHTEQGALLLERSASLRSVAPLVRWHHERWDGTGYPDRLAGRAIPPEATLISVCDAFDAITHSRQYSAARSVEQARAVLEAGAGSQWSPAAVGHLLAQLDAAGPGVEGVLAMVGVGEGCPDAVPPTLLAPAPVA